MAAAICEKTVVESWSGDRLKEIRENAGYRTLVKLSEKMRTVYRKVSGDRSSMKYGDNTLSRWESNFSTPGADDLYLLAYCLGVTCHQLGLPVGSDITFKDGKVVTPRNPDDIPNDEKRPGPGRPRKPRN